MWPIAIYLHVGHTAWAWLYVVDPTRLAVPALVGVLIANTGALLAGFALGVRLIRAGKFRELTYSQVGGLALIIGLAALVRRRLFTYASFDAFRAGGSLARLGQVKLGYVLVVLILTVIGALGYASYQLRMAGRRLT
jgi:hypothetical protein